MLNVAIIDDGVNLDEVKVDYSFKIDRDLNIIDISSLNEINHESHGTTCLKIIKKYLKNKDKVAFYSIKIINSETIRGNVDQFVKALEYCLSLHIDVIHLSIGSSYFKDFNKIEEVIKRLANEGTIITAALNNERIITYPAYLSCVIGVKTDRNLKDNEYRYNIPDISNIEITASSAHLLRSKNGIYKSQISNSYATPLITSIVINYLLIAPDLSIDEIKNQLKTDALYKSEDDNKYIIDKVEIPIILFDNFPQDVLESLLIFIEDKFYEEDYHCGIIKYIDYKSIWFMNYDIALLNCTSHNSIDINDISLIIEYDADSRDINVIHGDIYSTIITNKVDPKEIYEVIFKLIS